MFHDMATYISFMRSPNHWMCSKITKLKLGINVEKESKVSYLIVVVNTMADMIDQGP